MKIAIIHDDLMRRGGAEQVALALHRIYPNAPIYTLCYRPNLTYPEFKEAKVITSIYQKFVKTESQMKVWFYPFGFWAMRLLKIKGYDLVILSSTYASKYANIEKGTRVINYCHNPFRLAWYPESYVGYSSSKGIKRWLYNFITSRLRKIDYRFARMCTTTVVNSEVVKQRISNVYSIEADSVINPPINLLKFHPIQIKEDHYLVVSRLETYKKVDLVIKAFNLSGKSLVIIGNGSQSETLKRMAKKNIVFKHDLSSEKLAQEYAKAKALVFPQFEDFGITPLEANASGTPVIAYGMGGVLETIIAYPQPAATGLFFMEQSTTALNEAIERFEKIGDVFKETDLLKNPQRFSFERFSQKIIMHTELDV